MNWIRSRKLPLFERIPVRWRIAITTAGLTLLILVCFALVLGQVVGNRIRSDFREELRSAARSLAAETSVSTDPVYGEIVQKSPPLRAFALARGRRRSRSSTSMGARSPGPIRRSASAHRPAESTTSGT